MKETRHLGVYGVVIKNGKILLIKKARGAYTGKYDLPGGSIEHGEEPIETLKRELLEETESIITKANLLTATSAVVNWTHHEEMESMHHIGIIYDAEIENDEVKKDADGLDSLGAVWYDINKLTKDDISPLTYEALKLKGYKIK